MDGATLAAGERLVLIADSLPSQAGEIHLGFGLSSDGETVSLTAPGAVPTTVDAVSTVPAGDMKLGGQPVRFAINPQYNLQNDRGLTEWSVAFTFTALFPTF